MSFLGDKKAGRRFGAMALAVFVGGALACNVDRSDVAFQEGDYVFDFLVDLSLTSGIPVGNGSIADFVVASIDLSVPDGFERSIDGNDVGYMSAARGDPADGTDFGPGWNFGGWDRNILTDGRTPALVASTAVLPADDGFVIGDPAEVGGDGLHNPFTEGTITGLAPNTTYVVAFWRYSLTVNGELDQEATLLNQAISADDALAPVGGSPLGDPTVPIVSFPTIIPFQASANPYVLGNFTTDANGDGFFDVVIDGSAGELYTTTSGDPTDGDFNTSLVARNDDVPTNFPRYNYLVIHEGAAVDAADAADNPQAMRIQIGQDFTPAGAAINNAYAPFPGGALSTTDLLPLPVAAGQASELTMTFGMLPQLSGAVYQVWLVNTENSNILSPLGTWVAQAADSLGVVSPVDSAQGVNTFNFNPAWQDISFTTSDAQAGQEVGPYTHVVITVESSAASTPSAVQPLWWFFTDMAGDPADPFGWSFMSPAGFSLGDFNGGTDSFVWAPAGNGEGGFWGSTCVKDQLGKCEGRTDLLIVVFRNLFLPPEGFFYEAWLIADDGSEVNAGPLLSSSTEGLPRTDLTNLDVDQSLTELINTAEGILLMSETKTTEEQLGGKQFFDFVEYRLTLKPKDGPADRSGITVLGGLVPEPLKLRKPEPEQQ